MTTIRIVEYDPAWPRRFEEESDRLRRTLGERALAIEHVGSTSVPGLAAKPVLDIVLIVACSSDEGAYAAALEEAGFQLRVREPAWYEHRLFKGPQDSVNLHVFSEGCPEPGRMLAFRDWLRANPQDRALYERTKQSLAQHEWPSTDDYAAAKGAVIGEIMSRARNAPASHAGPATDARQTESRPGEPRTRQRCDRT